jgi:hypothetical protein
MPTTTDDSRVWAHLGEPRRPIAGFIASDADWPGLPADQVAAIRSLEFAERAEERARAERVAEHREAAYNRMVAESISRAHAHGRQWDPQDPLRDYPSIAERTELVFAQMDAQSASELRAARREAAAVLRRHGVHAMVTVDSNAPDSPHPAGPEPSGEGAQPPASRSTGMASLRPGAAATPLGTRIRGALSRWASPKRGHTSGPAGGCGCAACVPGSVRSDDGSRPLNGPEELGYR